MICIILVAGHETNLDQEIQADKSGQFRHLEGKDLLFNLDTYKYLLEYVLIK